MSANYTVEYFLNKLWSFVVVKNGKIIYRSKKHRLKPLLFCLKHKKSSLKRALVYDKRIGRAAALLIIYAKISEVMTPLITGEALTILKKNKIKVTYIKLTRRILNEKGDGPCPMEKLSEGKTAQEFFETLV